MGFNHKILFHQPNKLILDFLLVAFLTFTLSLCSFADTGHPESLLVKSACEFDYPPFCFVIGDGKADGFSVELFNAAIDAMGATATFQTATWPEIKSLLADGRIDALPLVGRTPERENGFDFTFSYLSMHGSVFVREGASNIQQVSDLVGKKIAVMKGDNAEEYLLRSKLDCQLITTSSFLDAFNLLAQGKCDAVVIHRLVGLRLLSTHKIANIRPLKGLIKDFKQDFCFAVREGNKNMLALLNEGLALTIANGTYRQLHAKWFGNLELPDNRKIIISGDNNSPPFEFIDENGQPQGFNVDITRAVAAATGMDYEIRLMPWSDALKALENGTVDAIETMVYTKKRDEKFAFTQGHTFNTFVVVHRKGSTSKPQNLNELKNYKIIARAGIVTDFLKELGITGIPPVDSQANVLELLAQGQFDIALVPRLTASYWLEQNKSQNLEIIDISFFSTEHCFAVQNNQTPLLTKFSEGLKLIEDSGEYRKIQKKWHGIDISPRPDLKDIFRYVLMLGAPLLVIIGIFFFWSWTLRKQVAIRTKELNSSEAQFRVLIEGAPFGIFVETEHNFAYVNNAACSILGVQDAEQLIHKPVIARFHQDSHKSILEISDSPETGSESNSCNVLICKNEKNNTSAVEISSVAVTYNGQVASMFYMYDITERQKLESQLRQAQKLEAIGLLAGGVAHDFNNMLSVIMGYSELALVHLEADHKACEFIEEVVKAAQKSGDITGQLLAFARQQNISPKILNLHESIEGSLKMLKRLISEDIELIFAPGTKEYLVAMDPSQLDQILANLCINARDSIIGTGKIKISLSYQILGPTTEGIKPGNYVNMRFTDTGCGIAEELLEKIFEPFYSTKALGKGTGLGLATVYGIVKQNNGTIHVTSIPGEGTTFNLYFPEATRSGVNESENFILSPDKGQGQTILIVEDDESILQLAEKILKLHGYKTITADNPDYAIKIVSAYQNDIAMILTDVIMPGMNGKDLAEKIAKIKPDIKCLFMSGYTADIIATRGIIDKGINFLPKPFSANSLINKVSDILN